MAKIKPSQNMINQYGRRVLRRRFRQNLLLADRKLDKNHRNKHKKPRCQRRQNLMIRKLTRYLREYSAQISPWRFDPIIKWEEEKSRTFSKALALYCIWFDIKTFQMQTTCLQWLLMTTMWIVQHKWTFSTWGRAVSHAKKNLTLVE